MTKVYDFEKERVSREPHMSGPATCLECGHEWQAVAPVGTYQMECPECGLFKGVYSGLCQGGPEDTHYLMCSNCEYAVFNISPSGIWCCYCGSEVHIPDD